MTNDSTKAMIVGGLILSAEVIAALTTLYVLFNGKENAPKVKD